MVALVDTLFCEFHRMGAKAVFRAAAIAEILERVQMHSLNIKIYTPSPKEDEEEEEEGEEEAPSGGFADEIPHAQATLEEEAA